MVYFSRFSPNYFGLLGSMVYFSRFSPNYFGLLGSMIPFSRFSPNSFHLLGSVLFKINYTPKSLSGPVFSWVKLYSKPPIRPNSYPVRFFRGSNSIQNHLYAQSPTSKKRLLGHTCFLQIFKICFIHIRSYPLSSLYGLFQSPLLNLLMMAG